MWLGARASGPLRKQAPQLMETSDKAHLAVPYDRTVQRWFVNGELVGNRGVFWGTVAIV